MSKPTPTPSQIALIEASKEQKQKEIDALNAQEPLIDAQIADKTEIDNAFKDQFNWYNDNVIDIYNQERRAINGVFEVDSLTNQDVEDVVFDPTNARLFPDPGNKDVKRIAQFDGGVTDTDTDGYELLLFPKQAQVEDQLVNGFGGTVPGGTLTNAVTTTAITPASTQVTIDDTTDDDIVFAIGDVFILTDTINQVAIEVAGFAETALDSGIWDVDFTFLSSGSVGIGSTIDTDFIGFDNTERTTKTSVDYQDIMDGLIVSLENVINERITKYDELIGIRDLNEDPDGDFDNTDINNSRTFLNNYLLTTDISDTGLASIASDRTTRSSDANNRITEISNAFTGQTEDYYESRYQRANDRAQIRRGTLTEINRLELLKGSNTQQAQDRTEAITAFDSILP